MPAVGKKLHHFVPRFYLQAWAKNRQIHCLQEGEVFRANLKNVAAENHFYRLRALSNNDITFSLFFFGDQRTKAWPTKR
jgi:Protein of unknown function (DUF4238)